MSPGQRRYIEGRIERLEPRARWLRYFCKKPEADDWHHAELADYETKIAALRAKLN